MIEGMDEGDTCRAEPRRMAIAVLTVSSSILRPSVEVGGAVSQAPDSFLLAASGRDENLSFAWSRRVEK